MGIFREGGSSSRCWMLGGTERPVSSTHLCIRILDVRMTDSQLPYSPALVFGGCGVPISKS